MTPNASLYDGLEEVFKFIRDNGIKTALVTTTPRPYVEKVAIYFNIQYDYIVAYHYTLKKLDPTSMIKAIQLLKYKTMRSNIFLR